MVRGRYTGNDQISRLNLKFLDRPAPDRLVMTDDQRGRQRRGAAGTGSSARVPVAGDEPPPPLEGQRRQIIDAYQRRTSRSYFEILGIPRAADERQVREAYSRLARQFHPDAVRDPELDDLKPEINAVFIRIGQARDVLTDPERRSRHESDLGRPRPEPVAQKPTSAREPASERPRARTEEEIRAIVEEVLARSRSLLASKKPWEAIQAIESALPIAGTNLTLRHQLQLVMVRAMIRNPKWMRRAEDILRGVIQENARNVEAQLALGALYEANGLKGRARRAFEKVLEIDARNTEARSRLEVLGPRKDQD